MEIREPGEAGPTGWRQPEEGKVGALRGRVKGAPVERTFTGMKGSR